jgi:hypothetical protein
MWRGFVLIALAVGNAPLVAIAAVPGRVPATFSISPAGCAEHLVTWELPPGVHGVHPWLAIAYGHTAGRTTLGADWCVSCLSTITRSAQKSAPVKLVAGDYWNLTVSGIEPASRERAPGS